ncbi:hypothetical protein SEA_REYNAULD_96 [Rhodococcus phage Reynauld]|uniref:Uncharacterized protein n=1 Tax=Rhodococcus phage Reynauld TaxID=3062845 RepID=A0ACD4UHA7_9CAUD|nr:hypothetical protein SEA_REYNAULD_96 [Rhodococcus phage Reynauld]
MTEIQINGHGVTDLEAKRWVLDNAPGTAAEIPDEVGITLAGYAAQAEVAEGSALEDLIEHRPVEIDRLRRAVRQVIESYEAAGANGARGIGWELREMGVLEHWIEQLAPAEPYVDPVRIGVTLRLSFDPEFLSDVLTTAIEGGINYWAHVSGIQAERDRFGNDLNASASIAEKECEGTDGTRPRHNITLQTIAVGLSMVLKQAREVRIADGADHTRSTLGYLERLAEYILAADAGMIDAGDADTIVQLGLFGEVKFG